MEAYITGATSIFRIFSHPERYAIENIREKTEATLVWTVGYLFLMATLAFLFQGKDVDEAGTGTLVVLWALCALTASVFLRFQKQTGEMTYGEGALVYPTCYAAFLTAWVLGLLITPYGQEVDGIGAALPGGVLVYFFLITYFPQPHS